MKVELNKDISLQDDWIEIYFRKMTPIIKRVVQLATGEETLYQVMGKGDDGEQIYINVEDIFYIESVDKKTFAYTQNLVLEIAEPLAYYDKEMKAYGFIRINKSVVVNIYHISSIKPELNMRVSAVMDNGEKMMINRSYKKVFVDFLKEKRDVK